MMSERVHIAIHDCVQCGRVMTVRYESTALALLRVQKMVFS